MKKKYKLVGAQNYICFAMGITDPVKRDGFVIIEGQNYCDHISSLSWRDKLGYAHPLFEEVVDKVSKVVNPRKIRERKVKEE